MADALQHRGPDGEGCAGIDVPGWSAALSHRRLAIIDRSPAGAQPMVEHSTGVCLTYNGEIYNFREIRRELQQLGHSFRSVSDTEVLLHAYLEWGRGAVDRIDGMFAFALWDPRRMCLLVARDRFGIKPVYYYYRPGEALIFGSEVRCLLASGAVPRQIDTSTLVGYLETGSCVSPNTLVDGVFSLAPGHVAEWTDGSLSINRYWDLAGSAALGRPSREEIATCLVASVSSEMVSDVPIGLFLSGGIDSSALVSVLAWQGNANLRTVSLAFDDENLDERAFARRVATQFGTHHCEVLISSSVGSAHLPRIAQLQDLPSVDGFNMYLVSRAARESGLTVALSGLGGDELFAGYDSFRVAALWPSISRGLRAVPFRRHAAATWSSITGGRQAKLARIFGDATRLEDVYAILREIVPPVRRMALLRSDLAAASANARPLSHSPDLSPLTAMTLLETSRYMLDTTLAQADAMSMAVSLEVRVPLLSYKLAELAVRTPDSIRLRQGVPKPLLLDALPSPLPTAVVNRRKGTFSLPFGSWLRGAHRPLVEDLLLSRTTRDRGLLAPDAVLATWNAFLDRQPGTGWAHVWVLAVLEAWCRANIDVPNPGRID